MLKHEATRLILGLLRLAAEPAGLADVWLEVKATLAHVEGNIEDDDDALRLGDELSRAIHELRTWMTTAPVDQTDPAKAVDNAVDALGRDELIGYIRSAHPGDDLNLVLSSLTDRLRHVISGARNWAEAFAAVEATDSVTLMTIHRSKGLEYHTVFL